MEIGKNNRIEQTPIHDLNLPANPHGYWLFGSLDFQSGNMISSPASHWQIDVSGGQNRPVRSRLFAVVGHISGKMRNFFSMVRIVLRRLFCPGFARIFGKMQDGMQDKREPAKPHGNWAAADMPAGRSRKMRDLNPILCTNSRNIPFCIICSRSPAMEVSQYPCQKGEHDHGKHDQKAYN